MSTPEYRRAYYLANCERMKADAKANYHANKDRRAAQKHAWYLANRDEQRRRGSERSKQWEKLHPERARAKSKESMRRRRKKNPDAVNRARRLDYQKNSEARRAKSKEWCRLNPERVYANAIKSKHRRRSRLAMVVVEHVERLIVFERDGWICGICLLPVEMADASLDHIVPIAKGGAHTYANIQTAHLKCNIKKGAKIQETAA